MLFLASCRFPRGRVQSQTLTRSFSQRGIVSCALDSHLHHAVDTLLPSATPPPLHRLDHTKHHFAPVRDADRSFPEQIRTSRRKCPPASTTHYPASTGEATC